MDFTSKTIEELEARKAEINKDAFDACTSKDEVNSLVEERNAIDAELESRASLEAAKAEAREKIANGEGTIIKNFEEEVNKMEEVRTFAPDTVEYRDAYLKDLMGKQVSAEETRALTSAASVVPTEIVNKIYGLLEKNPLIAEVNALHVPGYVQIPKATAVADSAWEAIGTASTDSDDVVGSVSLSVKKLIKTIEITADIQAMSIPAFMSWLVEKLVAKMEKAICAAIINGAGTATVPTGILKDRTADETGVSTVAKLGKLMGDLGAAYHDGSVWIMSSATFYTNILPLANDKNGIFVMNGIDKMLLGHKVVLDDACDVTSGETTTKNIIYGNLNEGYVFNFGEDIAIESDKSVAFRTGSTVYRAMALCDGAVADAAAFVLGTV